MRRLAQFCSLRALLAALLLATAFAGAVNVTLSSPLNNSWASNFSLFSYSVANASNVSYCELWTNQAGWSAKQVNASLVNGSAANFFNASFSSEETVVWSVGCNETSGLNESNGTIVFAPLNYSLRVDLTPPSPPVNVSASVGFGSVMLSWVNSTDSGSGVANHSIYRNGSFAANASGSLLSNAPVAGASYAYAVYANDVVGNVGNASNVSVFFPIQVSQVASLVSASSRAVNVSLISNTVGNLSISAGLSNSSFSIFTSANQSSLNYSISLDGLFPGKTYFFNLTSCNALSCAAFGPYNFSTPSNNYVVFGNVSWANFLIGEFTRLSADWVSIYPIRRYVVHIDNGSGVYYNYSFDQPENTFSVRTAFSYPLAPTNFTNKTYLAKVPFKWYVDVLDVYGNFNNTLVYSYDVVQPSPTPTPSPTLLPSPVANDSVNATLLPSPIVNASVNATPSPLPSPTVRPSPTATPSIVSPSPSFVDVQVLDFTFLASESRKAGGSITGFAVLGDPTKDVSFKLSFLNVGTPLNLSLQAKAFDEDGSVLAITRTEPTPVLSGVQAMLESSPIQLPQRPVTVEVALINAENDEVVKMVTKKLDLADAGQLNPVYLLVGLIVVVGGVVSLKLRAEINESKPGAGHAGQQAGASANPVGRFLQSFLARNTQKNRSARQKGVSTRRSGGRRK